MVLFKMVVEPSRQSSAAQSAASNATVTGDNKPGSFKHLLGNRNVVLCLIISCLFITWFISLTTFAPLYLMETRHFSPSEMGMIMTVLGLSSVLGGFLVPGLSDRIGRRPTMIMFSLLAVTVPLVLVYAQVSLPVLALMLFVTYFGYGVFPIFLATIPAESIGIAHAGKAISLVIGLGEVVGGFFAPMLEGYAADRFGAHAPFLIASGATLLAVLVSFGLKETAPAKLRKLGAAAAPVKQGLGI
jgi:predicted MFS family arabinose efflux permease